MERTIGCGGSEVVLRTTVGVCGLGFELTTVVVLGVVLVTCVICLFIVGVATLFDELVIVDLEETVVWGF